MDRDGGAPGEPRDPEPVRLGPAERAALYPDLDHDALERLLACLPRETRPALLRFFRDWTHVDAEAILAAFPEITPAGPPGGRTFVLPQPEDLSFEDPSLQALLQAVLARRNRW